MIPLFNAYNEANFFVFPKLTKKEDDEISIRPLRKGGGISMEEFKKFLIMDREVFEIGYLFRYYII